MLTQIEKDTSVLLRFVLVSLFSVTLLAKRTWWTDKLTLVAAFFTRTCISKSVNQDWGLLWINLTQQYKVSSVIEWISVLVVQPFRVVYHRMSHESLVFSEYRQGFLGHAMEVANTTESIRHTRPYAKRTMVTEIGRSIRISVFWWLYFLLSGIELYTKCSILQF